MTMFSMHVGRIRELASKITALEEKLMSSRQIPMSEQAVIHAQIRKLRAEIDELEKRTR